MIIKFILNNFRYYAGYVIRKLSNCETCKPHIFKDFAENHDFTESLIINKRYQTQNFSYSGLANPSDKFFKLCTVWMQIFEGIFYFNPSMSGISKRIIDSLLVIMKNDSEFNWYQSLCEKHQSIIIKRYIQVNHIN